MLHGIDISNYQRGLRIADIQADFVIVKASEGVGYADPSAKDLAHQTLQSGRRLGSVMFVIDEFKLLPQLMHIDDALNFGRGLGVKVFAGIQSVDQVYAGYGEERGRALLSGFMNCFCFQTPDYSSRQYITQRFGENCVQLLYQARNESLSYQREGHALEDWDVLNLKVGQAAVDLAGEKPFLFQFPEFRQNGTHQFM